jgi:hypothetical protein
VNSKYENIVVRFQLSKFKGGTFYKDELILRPTRERTHFDDVYWKVSRDTFPEEGGAFAIDLTVFNMWGDELHSIRQLGDLHK